jgi:hypothetical protein
MKSNSNQEHAMSIQKKSLISNLNTTKKAILASNSAPGVSTSEVRSSARANARGNARANARGNARANARANARGNTRGVK